ncbi:MAG TPA: hypothetical protein VLS49_17385 [Usitatibacter sp.]|nr:hypothetical protein [Usitatibacter sp.]
MDTPPNLSHRPFIATAVAAALSLAIAVGVLAAVSGAFRRDGAPLERLRAAENACIDHEFLSEREACMGTYLAAARARHLASR